MSGDHAKREIVTDEKATGSGRVLETCSQMLRIKNKAT
jgi:hypothetical protein